MRKILARTLLAGGLCAVALWMVWKRRALIFSDRQFSSYSRPLPTRKPLDKLALTIRAAPDTLRTKCQPGHLGRYV